MKKKLYIEPQLEVIRLQDDVILASQELGFNLDDWFDEENVGGYEI